MLPFERRWVSIALDAFAPATSRPSRGELAPRPGEVAYEEAFERMRRASTFLGSLGLRLALWLVILAPVCLRAFRKTLPRLSVERRGAVLQQLLSHRLFAVRELTLLLKLAAALALFSSPSVRAQSQYDRVPPKAVPAWSDDESGERRKLPVVNSELVPIKKDTG